MRIELRVNANIDKEKIYAFFQDEFSIPKEFINIYDIDKDKSVYKRIYDELKAGATIAEVSKAYHIRDATVRNNVIKLGWKPRFEHNMLTEEEKKQLYKDKEDSMSINDLSYKYKLTPSYLRTLFRKTK